MGDSSLLYVLFNVPPCPQRFQHHQQRRVNTVSSRLFSAPRRAQSEAFLYHQRSRGIGRTHYSEVNEEWVPWKPKGASQDSPSPGFPRATHFAKKIGFYETLTINFRISMSDSIFWRIDWPSCAVQTPPSIPIASAAVKQNSPNTSCPENMPF